MKQATIAFLVFLPLMVTSLATATQEVKDAAIVDNNMNHDDKVCTIVIDRDVTTNAVTKKCIQRKFSWKCFNDDYLWHMVLHIHKNKLPIDIRYSSEKCFDEKVNNMQLLTV